MISFFIKYRNPILITTVVIFLLSIGILGAGIVADQYGANAIVAKVGKAKIKYSTLINAYNIVRQRYIDEGREISEEQDKQLKQEILQGLISEEALSQAAEDLGIGTSKVEVAYAIKTAPMFAPNGEFNKNAYIYVVRNQFHVNPSEFESNLNKQFTVQKLRRVLGFCSVPTSYEKEVLTKGAPKELKASDKQALENYLFEIKATSFGTAFSDDLNAKHRSTINMQI